MQAMICGDCGSELTHERDQSVRGRWVDASASTLCDETGARHRPTQAATDAELAAERQERADARVEVCQHAHVTAGDDRCFVGCVAPRDCEPVAHGNITRTESCEDCGGERRLNLNGGREEASGWYAPSVA